MCRKNTAKIPVWQNLPTCNNFQLPCFVLSCFLFREMVRNSHLKVCFYSCTTERNSELFSLSPEGFLERNSESCFYFCSTERNSELFSLPRKGLELNSESFLFSFLLVFFDTTRRFWPRVHAHALCTPVFLGKWTHQTGSCLIPRLSQLRCSFKK